MPSTYAPTPGLSGSSLAWKKWSVLSAVLATSCSCDRFTASVSSVPAATLELWRSLPALPTDTLLSRSAIEPAPRATLLSAPAMQFAPTATQSSPDRQNVDQGTMSQVRVHHRVFGAIQNK